MAPPSHSVERASGSPDCMGLLIQSVATILASDPKMLYSASLSDAGKSDDFREFPRDGRTYGVALTGSAERRQVTRFGAVAQLEMASGSRPTKKICVTITLCMPLGLRSSADNSWLARLVPRSFDLSLQLALQRPNPGLVVALRDLHGGMTQQHGHGFEWHIREKQFHRECVAESV
jgi:hypothetical protein